MKKLLISFIGLIVIIGLSCSPAFAEKVVTLSSTQIDSVQFHIGKQMVNEGTEETPNMVAHYIVTAVVVGTVYDSDGNPIRQQVESTRLSNLPTQVKTTTVDLLKWFAKKYNNAVINLDADTLPDLE